MSGLIVSYGQLNRKIPFTDAQNGGLRICFDGQIGNGKALVKVHRGIDGPFREDELLLHLYQQHGREMFQYLFQIFVDHFGAGLAVDTVGQWLSL